MTNKRLLSVEEFTSAFTQVWLQVPERREVSDLDSFLEKWTSLMKLGVAVSYATFEGETARGILCGLISPDLHTGKMQGIEYIWAGKNTSGLLPEFEKDCRERGCTRMVFGLNPRVIGDRAPALRRFYKVRGFVPFTESFLKELK